ncbi:MAG: hypothetical protein R2825_01730 [Saprospiraceae bacterium]
MPKEPTDCQVMPLVQFGKRKRFSDQPTDPGSDGGVEPFNVKSQVFADFVLGTWDDASIGIPIICFKITALQDWRDFVPELLGRLCAPATDMIGHHQTVDRVVCDPYPTFVDLL